MQLIDRFSAKGLKEVRLVGSSSNEIVTGIEALARAEGEGLDLVLVSDKSTPPVVRIEDFKKLQYEAKKSKQKHGRTSELKEIQLKVNISDHDLKTKRNAIERFLQRGDKVKITVRLKGRERDTPDRAHQLIERAVVGIVCKLVPVPGPIAMAILEPISTKTK